MSLGFLQVVGAITSLLLLLKRRIDEATIGAAIGGYHLTAFSRPLFYALRFPKLDADRESLEKEQARRNHAAGLAIA